MKKLDNLLNKLTMYKLVIYGLCSLALLCLLLSLLGTLTIPFGGMALSLLILAAVCYVTNELMARIWHVPASGDSWFITALILFFILPQATNLSLGIGIALAGVIAMVSKYLINWQGKHIFNPAALAAATLGLAGLIHASWWVGSSLLWPFTLLLGLLIVRKTRRFPLLASFVSVSLLTTAVLAILRHYSLSDVIVPALTASPLIFLGTVMLTEPSTMPPVRRQQVIFGAIVGLLYAGQFNIGGFYVYPEIALLIGNIYAFTVSPKYRLRLRVKAIEKISDQVYNFVFTPNRTLAFVPGQYMEWTLGHSKADIRGNRRTFTIASSPTEPDVRLGVKFYHPSSTYKSKLHELKVGDQLFAGQISGNFTLPADPAKKLVFVAGGIGITPFRSMVKYLIDKSQKRDIVLFYLVSKSEELAYKDLFEEASAIGLTFVPVIQGTLDQALLTEKVPDFAERHFYLSGPQAMITSQKADLIGMGVQRTRIETDYFSGY
jgi:ferredoxin-NADP reductase/Na+-translocating ferredoxin:NAD+ oxidoreductase RnfD subunit